jgi:hypothetical protein
VVISPATFNFGSVVATTSSKPHTFTASNKSLVPAHLKTVTALLPPSSFVISPDNCSGQILAPKGKPKSACTMGVAYAPSIVTVSPPEKGTLTLPYDNINPATAVLEGTGIAATLTAPTTTVTLAGAKVGTTGTSHSITFTNNTAAALTLGTMSISANFTITSDLCSTKTLAPKGKPGNSCLVKAAFQPVGGTPPGTVLNGTLSDGFTYGANSGSVSVKVKGTVKP